jgi:hypothetical protein
MWTNDVRSVLNAIETMKTERNVKRTTLWLSHDLLEYYHEFKEEILYQLDENASIYIDGIPNNPSHIVYKYDGMYFVMYPLRESYPEQVMNISCYTSIDDYNNAMNF